jgi:phospholipid/cholesterol/gamma-HCH transport system substrate-binding protein
VTKAIQKHLRDFIAIIVLMVLALGVGGFILSHQRFFLPGWVPVLGTDFFELKGEFQTAQSVMPGQGQTVDIAGVPVGDVKKVELKNGRAIISMTVRQKYSGVIYRNASMLLRPKTGLNDMIVELTPGTPSAGKAPDGYTLPIQNTLPNINLEEFWAALDRDTRDYLKLLLAGGGQGLGGQGRFLSATLRRFEPTNRDIARITSQVGKRRKNLARLIHSFQLLATELGSRDTQLAEWVDSSNAVFQSFARQERSLRETVRLLPGGLAATNKAVASADRVAVNLGPAARELLPGARALASSLRDSRAFFKASVPPIKNQIRPFAREAQPAVRQLRPANENLAKITPDLRTTFKVINRVLNEWAYNPPGVDESYLFWTIWGAHIGASVFSTQDAQGPLRSGLILTTCRSLGILQSILNVDPQLATIIELLHPPTQAQACAGGK